MATVYIILLVLVQGNRQVFAYSSPYYNWPLDPGHSNLETTGHISAATGSCVSGDTGHPSLDYNSLKFNGNAKSFKEFTMVKDLSISNIVSSFDDFTFSVFVSPVASSGTILHYQKQDMTTGIQQIKGIVLSYNSNDTNLYMLGDNNTDVLVNVSLFHHYVDGKWTPVTVQFDRSGNELAIHIGPTNEKYKIQTSRYLGLPGKIRIGGSFLPGYSSYKGRASCLQFYDSKLGQDFADALQNCLLTSWPSDLGGNTDYSYPSCEAKKGYYEIISKERTPPSSTIPIANLTTPSKVRCADRCDLPSNTCVSFAINRSEKSCKLYNVNDSGNLVPENGTDYYVSRTFLNCC